MREGGDGSCSLHLAWFVGLEDAGLIALVQSGQMQMSHERLPAPLTILVKGEEEEEEVQVQGGFSREQLLLCLLVVCCCIYPACVMKLQTGGGEERKIQLDKTF